MLGRRFGGLELWLDPETDPRLTDTALALLIREAADRDS